ncbi:MAG: hypothetical protein JEY91_15190 [Spirochaetaceae bacterium]|nr:hypothetical protein [Spirochaetaceae bacterium]
MTDRKKLVFTALLFIILCMVPLYAQNSDNEEPEEMQKVDLYTLGDQCFSINAGLFIPLFFMDFSPEDGSSAVASTNLTLGGTGSLAYEAYLSNHIKLGLEIGGMFAYSPNMNPFFMVPITAKFGYEFHFGQFSLPIYIGTGINIITYKDLTNVQFLMKPGISLYYNYNSNWSFGGNLVWWVAPEIIPSSSSQNRVGNFLDVTISAQYHF